MNVCEQCTLKIGGTMTPKKIVVATCDVCSKERVCSHIPGTLCVKNPSVTLKLEVRRAYPGSKRWHGVIRKGTQYITCTTTHSKALTQLLLVSRALMDREVSAANKANRLAIVME